MSDMDDWAAAINALAANAPPAPPEPTPEDRAAAAVAEVQAKAAAFIPAGAPDAPSPELAAALDDEDDEDHPAPYTLPFTPEDDEDEEPEPTTDLPMAEPPTVEDIRAVPLAPVTTAPPVSGTTVPETFETARPAPVRPPDAAPATGLSRTAVLVDFTRTGWSASVRDKSITDAVITQAGAKATAGHFHKNLLPDKAPAVEAVKAAIQNAYEDYRTRTAPWLDSGTRIMSTAGYQEFAASQREHAGRIEAAKRELRAQYDSEVEKQRATLGALFNPADYPTADQVVAKYQAGYRVLPVPDSTTDFRMAVGEQERAALKAAYDEYTAEMLKANRAELARRVDKEVRHLADRMKTYNGGQTGSFRDTLVDNVRRMAEMLDSINITGDPEVTALADRIKADLCATDVATLRDSARQRRELAAKADSILADMSSFIA